MKAAYCRWDFSSLIIGTILFPILFFSVSLFGAQSDPKKRPTAPTKNCISGGCHAEVTSYAILHGAIKTGACAACHRSADAVKHTFQLTRQGNNLCLFCHKIAPGAYTHKPMTDKTCVECHSPHGGETRTHLLAKTTRALCEKCHAKTVNGKMEHKPLADGGCLACHTTHTSNYPKLLRQESSTVCLDCHVVFANRMKQSKTVHKPVREGCLKCHNPHASSRPKLLAKSVRETCFSCHEAIRLTVEHAKIQHGALSEIRECVNCHDSHAARYSKLLRDNTRAVCLKCHDKEVKTPKGVISDMSKVLKSGKNFHGPFTINDCGACHQIHGGEQFDLLNKKYPSEFYSSFREENYALCFSCHNPNSIIVANTTTLTGFRNGDMNLHSVHVSREIKGRTCRACHDIHLIDREKYIRDSVPFGDWKFSTDYTKTPTGGSCTPGCHEHLSYDRQHPVQYERKLETPREEMKGIIPGGK